MWQIPIFRIGWLVVWMSAGLVAGQEKRFPVAGINAGWQDFSPETTALAFPNVIKNASRWTGGPFEADAFGYPLRLEEMNEAVISVFRDNARHYPLGDYTLAWEGKGHIEVRTAGKRFKFTPEDQNRQIIPIEAHSDYGIQISIRWVPMGNHIRNLRLFLPGHDESSGFWTEHYVEDLKPFGLLRFMWGSGAWSFYEVEHWEQRRSVKDYHWMGGDEAMGIPYEAMVDLANRTGNDLWVCAPHRANEEYMRKMAEFFRDHLDPELTFWIEYSNEYWLDIDFFKIAPNDYLQEEVAAMPESAGMTVDRLYAQKAIRLFEIFTEVFAEKGQEDRLIRVVCGCAAEASFLEELAKEIDRLGKMDLVDAMGIGPYFRPNEEETHFEEALDKGWDAIFKSVHRTLDDMFDPQGIVGEHMYRNAAVAEKYGKKLVAYESGQHYTTWTNTPGHIIAPMNRRPEMYEVYQHFFRGWESLPGASTLVLFQACSLYNDHEAFGLREYYDQPEEELHKRRSTLDWMALRGER